MEAHWSRLIGDVTLCPHVVAGAEVRPASGPQALLMSVFQVWELCPDSLGHLTEHGSPLAGRIAHPSLPGPPGLRVPELRDARWAHVFLMGSASAFPPNTGPCHGGESALPHLSLPRPDHASLPLAPKS